MHGQVESGLVNLEVSFEFQAIDGYLCWRVDPNPGSGYQAVNGVGRIRPKLLGCLPSSVLLLKSFIKKKRTPKGTVYCLRTVCSGAG